MRLLEFILSLTLAGTEAKLLHLTNLHALGWSLNIHTELVS